MGTVHSVSRALTGTQSYSSERSASVFGEHASDKGPRLTSQSARFVSRQQCLNLRPLRHGHGSLRPIFATPHLRFQSSIAAPRPNKVDRIQLSTIIWSRRPYSNSVC
jgi:hypothetical protein